MKHRMICLIVAITLVFSISCGFDPEVDKTKVYTNYIAIKEEPFSMNWYGEGVVLSLSGYLHVSNVSYDSRYRTNYLYCLGASLDDNIIKNIRVGTVYKISYRILGHISGEHQYKKDYFVYIQLIAVEEEKLS